MPPPAPARDKVPGSAPPAQDRVPGSEDRRQGNIVTACLEADFAGGRRVNNPFPRRPRTRSPAEQARPRWPRTKSPCSAGRRPSDDVTAVLVAGFAAAAMLEWTELPVNPPGSACFVARSCGKGKLQSMVVSGLRQRRRTRTLCSSRRLTTYRPFLGSKLCAAARLGIL